MSAIRPLLLVDQRPLSPGELFKGGRGECGYICWLSTLSLGLPPSFNSGPRYNKASEDADNIQGMALAAIPN